MKKLVGLLVGLLMVLGVAGTASALSFTDTHNPDDFFMAADDYPWENACDPDIESYTWQFNIAQWGFDPDNMLITDATVDLLVGWAAKDDEYVEMTVSPFLGDPNNIFEIELENGLNSVVVANVSSIQKNGKTMMQLEALDGRFIFKEAVLNVNAVPEPTTMLLFGVGLLGVVRVSRKKTA